MNRVCVHGLGYVGLPTATVLANYEYDVYGFDTNESLRERLREGELHLEEAGLRAFVTQAFESGKLTIADEIPAAKYHVICVPTPMDMTSREADLSAVRAASSSIAEQLRPGDTVILESTVPPGTTVDVVRPILEDTGLIGGDDFALAFSPETVLPGAVIQELRENDRVIGGLNGISTESARRLYGNFVEGKIRVVSDPTIAEFVKLLQNTFRDTNIALANEIAKLAADYDVDSRTAISLANTHPRVEILDPGPGVGGHCLPIDPWFLGHGSDELDLIATARRLNDGMASFVVDLLADELGGLEGRRIAVLGIAYKGNVPDTRQSPGYRVIEEIESRREARVPAPDGGVVSEERGTEVFPVDPVVGSDEPGVVDIATATAGADAIVITTDHDEFTHIDPDDCLERMNESVVIDTKAVLDQTAWEQAGARFIRL